MAVAWKIGRRGNGAHSVDVPVPTGRRDTKQRRVSLVRVATIGSAMHRPARAHWSAASDAAGETRMNVLIAYYSETGNTAQVARAICDAVASQGHAVDLEALSEVTAEALSDYDLVYLGSPCHDADLARPAKRLLQEMGASPPFALAGFCTHATHMPGEGKDARALLQHDARKTVGRDTRYQHTTGPVLRLEDADLVALEGEVVCRRETCWARPDHSDPLPDCGRIGVTFRLVDHWINSVGYEALQSTEREGFLPSSAKTAVLLTPVVAYSRTYRRKGVRLADHSIRVLVLAAGDESGVAPGLGSDRTGRLARCSRQLLAHISVAPFVDDMPLILATEVS